MYPLNTQEPWPEAQWYVAAIASEVGRSLLNRRLLGRKMILFRDEAGIAHALSGVCPHRMMPLHLGKLKGDTVECGYHGLTFDTSGACVAAPTSTSVPSCAIQTFPLVERGPLLWAWVGDPTLAATTPLPVQEAIGIGTEGWRTDFVRKFDLPSRYALLIENLFDLSHLGFVHASIVGEGGIALIEPRIEERDGRLTVSRIISDEPTDFFHRFMHPEMGERMTVRLESEMIGVGLINSGGPCWDGPTPDSPYVGTQNFIHIFTPETEHSTHYWTMLARDFRHGDDALTETLSTQNVAVVSQDIEALEIIEQALAWPDDLPREISMRPDAGALRARLRLIQMIKAEEGVNKVGVAA